MSAISQLSGIGRQEYLDLQVFADTAMREVRVGIRTHAHLFRDKLVTVSHSMSPTVKTLSRSWLSRHPIASVARHRQKSERNAGLGRVRRMGADLRRKRRVVRVASKQALTGCCGHGRTLCPRRCDRRRRTRACGVIFGLDGLARVASRRAAARSAFGSFSVMRRS
jgi:hypothetical protein